MMPGQRELPATKRQSGFSSVRGGEWLINDARPDRATKLA